MPANIAHLLICNKAVKVLQSGGEYEQFISILDQDKHKPYLNLGSVGPDLSYYGSKFEGLKSLLLEQSDKPLGVDGWSYLLHSKEPNRFPLSLIELTWKDANWKEEDWDEVDLHKFAFACGYLSHMAADQIIHPVVNDIAGPYYRTGENRKVHRRCEIYQDVALFHTLYENEDFMEKHFNRWVDIAPDSSRNAPDWFRYFIQRAFVESHGAYPKEEEVEDWIDGLLLILRGMKIVGPYKTANEEWQENGMSSEDFARFFKGYMDYFFKAVELTGIYWKMVFELYHPPTGVPQISDKMRERFRGVVQNADLSSPLQRDIVETAKKAIAKSPQKRFAALLTDLDSPLDKARILTVKESDVGKF